MNETDAIDRNAFVEIVIKFIGNINHDSYVGLIEIFHACGCSMSFK